MYFKIFTVSVLLYAWPVLQAGDPVSPDRVPEDRDLLHALQDSISGLSGVYQLRDAGREREALDALSAYLREKSSERYYFNWRNFRGRFTEYSDLYPDKREDHAKLARLQMALYAPETDWILPFTNLRGEAVTAYELRHLARQQKSADMALTYYYENEKPVYLDYFVRQAADLNRAFDEGEYDDAGNGIYEAYRGGRRVQNWIFCHHAYLASPAYTDEMQRLLIRTLLHHGAQLYERTGKMRSGNHHTRGLVALFEIAAIFPEFRSSEKWLAQAIDGLVWHLTREVNPDGFQFERSVHYHKGDIDNYFRVYQLAKINHIPLPDIYERQFRKLFDALVMLAQPNRRLPVLQDDTDKPLAENNSMDEVMILGTIVFNEPVFKYFSGSSLSAGVYWLLRGEQLTATRDLRPEIPEIRSCELPETGYYVMRNGWDSSAVYLTVTAGLSDEKPDHQHGDMLGLVAFANGHEILPNYQVKYTYPDYPFFKNSWVKNVALVDDHVLAGGWQQNEGQSGFGKWKKLPEPKVLSWEKSDLFDHFIGTHNGFDSLGVAYFREIFFFHEGFWLVIDHFESPVPHTYQQVWQGEFLPSEDNSWRKQYADGSGLDLRQLAGTGFSTRHMRFREKSNTIIGIDEQESFRFITLLLPFKAPAPAYTVNSKENSVQFGNWRIAPAAALQPGGQSWIIGHKTRGRILINAQHDDRIPMRFTFRDPVNFYVCGDSVQYLGKAAQPAASVAGIRLAAESQEQWHREIEVRPGARFIVYRNQHPGE